MRRYWAFCYRDFYPEGGFNDFQGSFDTPEEAQEYVETWMATNLDAVSVYGGTNGHVVDIESGGTILDGRKVP